MESVWHYRELLLHGTLVTVQLALASLLIAILLGLMGVMAKRSHRYLLQQLSGAYTTLVRGVPDLVLMMLLFYGGQQALNSLGEVTGWWDYLEINQFTAGVISIGFIFGAYMTETFRGAILAIPRGQIEAGIACGMTPMKIFFRITGPQMLRLALPGFTNNWLVLIKATALVSVIGLQDLVWNASTAGRSVHQPFSFMFAVLIIYLVLTGISDIVLRWIDRRRNVSSPKV